MRTKLPFARAAIAGAKNLRTCHVRYLVKLRAFRIQSFEPGDIGRVRIVVSENPGQPNEPRDFPPVGSRENRFALQFRRQCLTLLERGASSQPASLAKHSRLPQRSGEYPDRVK